MIGEKVVLRPILRSDLPYLNKWKNSESVFKFLGGGFQPVSIDQQEKWLDSLIDLTGKHRRYIIELKGDPVGMIGLYDINMIHRTCEIGLYIGEESAQNKGIASEACKLIERYAQNYLNVRKIKLKVVSDNLPAVAFWKKQGYETVGELKEERYIDGRYRNLFLMEKFCVGEV